MVIRRFSLCLLAVLYLSSASDGQRQSRVILLQQEDPKEPITRLLVVTSSFENGGEVTGCELYDDQKSIEKILTSASKDEVQTTSKEDFDNLVSSCGQLPSGNPNRELENVSTEEPMAEPQKSFSGYDGWHVIFPGTKWCGAGDIAKNYDDLGIHADTDKCCRAHDLCNDTLAPGATHNKLTNNSPFTKLSCNCDNDFYNCLDRVDSMISNKIGNLYFNILRRDCYESDYPLTSKCKKYRSFLKLTCKEYEKDTKAPKVYQWKKPKLYKKLPFPGPITVTLPF